MSRALSADVAQALCRLGLHPRDLVLYVTSACNLRCRHCYVGTDLLNAEESYDAADVVAFAASFPRLRRVTVLGGEPLLHERINEILTGLVALTIEELRVTTNLTGFFNLDRGRFRPEDLLVAVSLDGHDAATHDAVRGRRRFERTCANIAELVEAGWRVEVTHTVMRHNVDHLRHLIELCRRLGVGLLNLHLMSNMGNALQNPDLVVPAERWLEARRMLEGLSDPHGGLRIRYPPLFVTDAEYRRMLASGEYHPHAAGSYYADGDRVVLYPDGRVYISSEAFGTEAHIGWIVDGQFHENVSPSSELALLSSDPQLSIAEVTKERAGSAEQPRVLSVSFKRTIFA